MKFLHVLVLFIAIGVGLLFFRYSKSSSVLGTNIVGNETTEVCWNGTKDAFDYQVYYGQADTGVKDSSISEGLDNRSKCTKISHLKPCTTYVWNLLRLDGGRWTWQWEKDQGFATGGTCEVAKSKTTVSGTAKIIGNGTAVTTWTVANGANKYYIFYKGAGDTNWTHSVELSSKSTSYTINYLDPNSAYVYRVAALVDGKLIWQQERNLVIQ